MHVIPFMKIRSSFFPFHFDTHTNKYLLAWNYAYVFPSVCVVYCDLDLDLEFAFLLIQTIQIHFSVHLIFSTHFFLSVCVRWWIIMCVHTQALTRVSQASRQWLHVVAVVGSVICEFSVSNRGYDFPMREHHTFCCCSTFGGRWLPPNFLSLLLVALHDRLFVCLLACLLTRYAYLLICFYLFNFISLWLCV